MFSLGIFLCEKIIKYPALVSYYVSQLWQVIQNNAITERYSEYLNLDPSLIGANGSSRKAIRNGGLWKFLTVRQIYPLCNQS